MSLKPLKKSDLGKSWMKPRVDNPKKIQPEYHLIVTEGTDTEPAYFNRIKDIINSQFKGRIQLDIFGEGNNTLNLFHKAKERAISSAIIYKHVWIVYDTDDFLAAHIDTAAELCLSCSNEETQYHAIWSNQCIELWFLLHFSFMQSNIHRTEYWPKLTEWLNSLSKGAYCKNRQDMYDILEPFMDYAIANVKRLDSYNIGKKPSASAPGTKMYELIEKLRPYL